MIENTDFISIVIPYFKKEHYLKDLVESIKKYADFPYELIIHDDSGNELKSLNVESSTTILNMGLNLGLHQSYNRAIEIASSEYILALTMDMLLIKPILQDTVNVLRKPYVGILTYYNEPTPPELIDGKFGFRNETIGWGCAMSFRKSFWKEVGGFNIDTVSGCSDTPILYKCWRFGYFRGLMTNSGLRNVSREEKDSKDSTIGSAIYDCAYPKIFGISGLESLANERKAFCASNNDRLQNVESSDYNMQYWLDYVRSIIPDNKITTIDWEKCKRHGQDKWRDLIMREKIV